MDNKGTDQPAKRICIGKITSAHGVKGLVKILPYGEDTGLLEQAEGFKITLKNPMGKFILAEIEGVSDRDAAETLRNTELFIARDKLPEIKDADTFYYEDLVGLKAVDEDGSEIGKITAIENFGAGELLEIRLTSGQEVLVPFTGEYVPEVTETVTIRNYKALLG
ncbi:MAG: ribosome maturation factor RimM [Alphaproteobacteria bacterium]